MVRKLNELFASMFSSEEVMKVSIPEPFFTGSSLKSTQKSNCQQRRFSEQFNKMNSSKSQGPGSIKPSILKKLKYETAKLLISEITLESREIESCKCDAIKKKSLRSRTEKLLTSKIDLCTRQIGRDHRK